MHRQVSMSSCMDSAVQRSAVEPLDSPMGSCACHSSHMHTGISPPIPQTPRPQLHHTAYPSPTIVIANSNPVQGKVTAFLPDGTPTGVSLSSRRTAPSRLQIQFLQTPLLHALLGSRARGLLRAGTGGAATAPLVHALAEHWHSHAGCGKGSLEGGQGMPRSCRHKDGYAYVRTHQGARGVLIAPEVGWQCSQGLLCGCVDVHTTAALAGIATHGSAVCMTCTWAVDLTAGSCGSAGAAEALGGIMTLRADLPQAREICTCFGLDERFSS